MQCPVCATTNPEAARFCFSCGTSLAGPPAAAREERKVVSVLFADLVGFTTRAESLDPEDVEAFLQPYHANLRAELERFGGTVEKFIGDAVMAVFGAPVAHEDDAERAVRAALAIRDWAREQDGLELRIGVNTGEALVSLGARAEQGEALVKGDVVNTAARMQSAAPVNEVLAGEITYRATRNVIDYEANGPVTAKGKSEPIAAWRPIAARSRFGVDIRQIGGAPLVGRERELHALNDALARARSERTTQLVTLVGVPGIGKSRLVWELFQRVDAQPDLVTWRQGRCLPYGEGVSFWALGEMIKAQSGILESDSPEEAADKLAQAVDSLMGADTQRDWVTGHLRPLIGLAGTRDMGSERQAEAFAAWRRFLEALTENRPAVLVFEDLHWADEGLLDFIDHLADWAPHVPLLLLGTARPELLTRRPGWGGGKPNVLTLSLSPLSAEETVQLLHQLIGQPVLAAETQQALLERAGGNPLYAEEFVRLAEEGRDHALLPESVQAIIAARLDGLLPEEKQLVQQAAVLGKVFWLGGLEVVSGRDRWSVEESLHALERKEFVRRERHSSVAGEVEYAFRHALVREIAYEQLPRVERAERHRRAADWVASLGRPEDTAEMLAHHYLAALEYARAARQPIDDLAGPARDALRGAGERALALNSFTSAQRFFAAALDLTPTEDPLRPTIVFQQATALHATDEPEALDALEAASGALTAAGDVDRAAEAQVMLAELWWHAGEREKTDRHLARAEELIADSSSPTSRARVLSEVSRYLMLATDYLRAIEAAQQALAIAREHGLRVIEAHALDNIGVARAALGDERGFADLERSIEIAEAVNSPEAARGYNNLAAILWDVRADPKRSQEVRRQAVSTDLRFGRHRVSRFSQGVLIQHLYIDGEWDEFLEQTAAYVAEGKRLGRSYQESYLRAWRAACLFARGQEQPALDEARAAAEQARLAADPQAVLPVLSQLVKLEAQLGLLEDARTDAEEVLPVLALAPGSIRAVWGPALFADQLGIAERLREILNLPGQFQTRWAPVIRALADGERVAAADLFAEIGVPAWEAEVRQQAAEQHLAEGRRSEGDAQLVKALAFWRRVGATRYIRQAERLLGATG